MANRRPVRLLSEVVANQIAAGEVIERPASVVKELVENALDAGATRIEVGIEGGGAKCVEVMDNGCGMDRENALASLERQATSKIALSEDIERIATFGFRGEAIPSIASVSRFRMISRPEDAEGATDIHVVGGVLEQVTEAGHPQGTTITVRDLFFNVPARKKFLRAASTELARIRQALTSLALAHAEIAFRLQSDGRELFRLPEQDTLEDRIRTLLGDATMDALLPIDFTQGDIHIHGFISKLDFVRGGTPEHYVFVNRRPATAPQIQYALREAWPVREHRPVVILFVDLPPEEVDVNVHPAKREVRFRHGNHVIDALRAAVEQTLQTAHVSPFPAEPPRPIAPQISPTLAPAFQFAPRQTTLPLPQTPVNPYPVLRDLPPPVVPPITPPPAPPADPLPPSTLPWAWSRVVEILDEGYWLVVTDQGYVTVCATAAIERIFYERLSPAAHEALPSQPLLLPETLQLPPVDAERITRFLPELEACGFGIGVLGSDTFIIDALPVLFTELAPKEILAELAAELDRTGVQKGIDAWRREAVARAAASAACRSYKIKTLAAAEQLMAQLARCSMPYTSPRGKPIMILTTYRELARRFRQDS